MEKPRKRKDGEKETERVAVILQDGVRRFLIRKRVFRKQAAATTIQATVRRYLEKKRYRTLRQATATIRARVRSVFWPAFCLVSWEGCSSSELSGIFLVGVTTGDTDVPRKLYITLEMSI